MSTGEKVGLYCFKVLRERYRKNAVLRLIVVILIKKKMSNFSTKRFSYRCEILCEKICDNSKIKTFCF